MPLGKEVGLGPGHIVLDGDPVGTQPPAAAPPDFRPMPIVAKRSPISATAELVFFTAHRGLIPANILFLTFCVMLSVLRLVNYWIFLMVTLSMAEHVQQTITVYNQRLCSLRDCP